ncbi:hypothetical protein [Streptomyces sp. NPDC001661]
MRTTITTIATAGLLGLGLLAPAAVAQTAGADSGPRAASHNCDKRYNAAKAGYVYSYDKKNCYGYLGKDKDNDSNWSKRSDNKATAVLNKGYGSVSKVRFYRLPHYKGGSACLSQGEFYADDLSDNKFSNGKSANNSISSHKWISNSADCSANLT